jgi:hypothetical protein
LTFDIINPEKNTDKRSEIVPNKSIFDVGSWLLKPIKVNMSAKRREKTQKTIVKTEHLISNALRVNSLVSR